MGIDNLWPHIDGLSTLINVQAGELRGLTVAVDASVLMHGTISSIGVARQQVLKDNPAPQDAVSRFVHAFELLQRWGVRPVAFFDGMPRPAKLEEHHKRQEKRVAAKSRAQQLQRSGCRGDRSSFLAEQEKYIKEAAHVTKQLRRACVYALKTKGFAVVGSLCESDGQLALAYRRKECHWVMTNDSDLIALGCAVLRLPSTRSGGPLAWMESGCMLGYKIATDVDGSVTPSNLDWSWAISVYGHECLCWAAALLGCDYNNHHGIKHIGPVAAVKILSEVGKHGDNLLHARYWNETMVAMAVQTAEYRDCEKVKSSFGDEQVSMIRAVHSAFVHQPVIQDGILGVCGTLSGDVSYNADELLQITSDSVKLCQWFVGGGDPAHPSFEYHLPSERLVIPDDASVGAALYEDANNNVVNELQVWMRSRNLPVSAASRSDLLALVHMVREQDKQYGIMHIRDPSNTLSGGDLAVQRDMSSAEHLPQFDQALVPPTQVDDWMMEVDQIQLYAPLLSDAIIDDWCRDNLLLYEVDETLYKSESLKRGQHRCLNSEKVAMSISKPYKDHFNRMVMWLRQHVPRSQTANETRLVHICIEVCHQHVDDGARTCQPPLAKRILRALCPCTKGRAGCAHKVCTLFTCFNIPRPPSVVWSVPTTSKECNWNKPSREGWSYSELNPMEGLRTFKQYDDVTARPYSTRRPQPAHGNKKRSDDYQPRPQSVIDSIGADDVELKTEIDKLLDILHGELTLQQSSGSESD